MSRKKTSQNMVPSVYSPPQGFLDDNCLLALATFEKGQLLGLDLDRFACLRVFAIVPIIVLDLKT